MSSLERAGFAHFKYVGSRMNGTHLTTHRIKYISRLYGVKSETFASRKNQILFHQNIKKFDLFNLVNMENTAVAEVS